MPLEAWHVLRSLVFYTGYGASVVAWGLLMVAVAPWLDYPARYRLFDGVEPLRDPLGGSLRCGVRYRIHGVENLPSHGCVVIANHQSSWETIFLATLFPQLSILLKRELLKIPFFGWALALMQPIAIDRSNPRAALKQVVEQGSERLAQNCSVLIFPEGTRVDAGQRLRFSRSAAQLAIRAGVEIVCVAHDAGKCWPARRLTKTPGVINVVISTPMASIDSDAGKLMHAAQEWIEARLAEFEQGSIPVHTSGP